MREFSQNKGQSSTTLTLGFNIYSFRSMPSLVSSWLPLPSELPGFLPDAPPPAICSLAP